MLIYTNCHINTMIKEKFDTPLNKNDIPAAQKIITEAAQWDVKRIINVGTSLIESKNCILLAQALEHIYATVGIHPNDCTTDWRDDFKEIEKLVKDKERNCIVGIGECGMDYHYPDYNKERQRDAFRAQIELALEHDLALVVHSRDAYDDTLYILQEYKGQLKHGTIHCFSYDLVFAQEAIQLGFVLGIGGTITYPKNKLLREAVASIALEHIVLETDAPFLPIQTMRGKPNHPKYIRSIAEYLAELRDDTFTTVAHVTTKNACNLFNIPG